MTFLLSLWLATFLPMVYVSKALVESTNTGGRPFFATPLLFPALLGGGVVAAGLLSLFLPAVALVGTTWNGCAILFLLGGVITAWTALRAAFRTPVVFLGSAWILCAAAGVHLAYSAGDHLAFFWDDNDAGVLAVGAGSLSGLHCDPGQMIVRRNGREVQFRCPKGLRLMAHTTQPFFPWPAYDEGRLDHSVVVVPVQPAGNARDTGTLIDAPVGIGWRANAVSPTLASNTATWRVPQWGVAVHGPSTTPEW